MILYDSHNTWSGHDCHTRHGQFETGDLGKHKIKLVTKSTGIVCSWPCYTFFLGIASGSKVRLLNKQVNYDNELWIHLCRYKQLCKRKCPKTGLALYTLTSVCLISIQTVLYTFPKVLAKGIRVKTFLVSGCFL